MSKNPTWELAQIGNLGKILTLSEVGLKLRSYMAEKPILGLRVGEEISPVHEQIKRSKLLTDPGIEQRDTSIEDIYGTLLEHLGVELPLDLVGEMSFDQANFKWRQLYHHNALSAIFIGHAADDQERSDVNSAQGIIEVASYVPRDSSRVYADELVLSGITSDSEGNNRAFAIGYRISKGVAMRALVSVAPAEIPDLELGSRRFEREYRNSFEEVPTQLSTVYTAPLIFTPAMVAQADHRMGIRIFAYSEVYRNPSRKGMVISGHPLVEEMGFNTSSENGINYVGFKQNWRVSYPSSLPSVI